MKKARKVGLVSWVLLVLTISAFCLPSIICAGDLEPGAPPGPTMKTLDQIEPRIPIASMPFTISAPGSYYLTGNLTQTLANGDGIIIATDEVSLDLNGFTLYGGTVGDDGIYVAGNYNNIRIVNGSVVGWAGDGINASNADQSYFSELRVSENGGDGLVADFNCLIINCTAFKNGMDGLEGDDGTEIRSCTASENGDNGIQTSEGCLVVDCTAFNNDNDGFDVGAGSVVNRCTASDNGIHGFDIGIGGVVTGCAAYDNGRLAVNSVPSDPNDPLAPNSISGNGFDMASACILRDSIASLNNGHGVRTFANSYITDCKFHENDNDGIRISSTDCHVSNNQVTDNDHAGIKVTASGSFIFSNTAAGNLFNYLIVPTSSHGPIVNLAGGGDASAIPNANHPLANFEY